jgi:hypothetical protein
MTTMRPSSAVSFATFDPELPLNQPTPEGMSTIPRQAPAAVPGPNTHAGTKWISFLRQYGPVPRSGNMFDEDIQKLARRSGIEPLRLPTPWLDRILESLHAPVPESVIVTGTAGDGKTFHCREAWLALGGSIDEWEEQEKIKRRPLGDRELVVVRDLSEFEDDDRDSFFPQFAQDLIDSDPVRIYLVAANDGRLLELLKSAPPGPGIATILATIEDLLIAGHTDRTAARLQVVNLSRQSTTLMLPAVINAVLDHPGWSGCARCGLREGDESRPACPIWENRGRLAGGNDGGVLRQRLGDLAELSERNGVHFTVRQLFMLISNALLGHPDVSERLMACKDVPGILNAGTESRASIYRNIFGENLSVRWRERKGAFETLGRFGIGAETSNRIDSVLVYGPDDPDLQNAYERLVLADPVYGGSHEFRALQRAYLESGDEGIKGTFLTALRGQRQRLFFSIPDEDAELLQLWDLTVFRYAGRYLDIVRRMAAGDAAQRSWVFPIVRGLNRIFTGVLVNNNDVLILASSGSHAQAKTSRVLEQNISVAMRLGEEVALRFEAGGLHLVVSMGFYPGAEPVRLPLSLLRYEFLCRVAEGALPSSFSLECYEDFLAFKANTMRALEKRRAATGEAAASEEGDLVLQFLSVGPDGRSHPVMVEVHLA